MEKFKDLKEIDFTLSIADVQKLKADRKKRKFILESLYEKDPITKKEVLVYVNTRQSSHIHG